MRLTIKDIAEMAKVSRSTVSRVVTNHPNVNAKTREKVLHIIKNSGFQPNSIAKGLAKGKIRVISLIVSDIRNTIFDEMIWEIQKNLEPYSYDVMLFNSNCDVTREQNFLRMANANRFAGVILFSSSYPNSNKVSFDNLNCPIVLINRLTSNPKIDTIETDNFQGGYIATRHLIELGHRKIGFLSGKMTMVSHHDRFEGYQQALKEFKIPYYPEYTVTYQNRTVQSGSDYALRIFRLKDNMPSAVFATGDMMAFGFLNQVRRAGYNVPRDISIVGFDDNFLSSFAGIDLTTVRQPHRAIAKKAVDLLVSRIEGKAAPVRNIILKVELIVRATTDRYHTPERRN
jgi:LacI family transcriptional regulator